MKLFKFIVPFIGIAAVGCTSISVDQVQDNPGSKAETRTFICSIGSPDSKVVTDASGKTQWEVGDEILVHGEYIGTTGGKQYSTIVTLTAGDISLDKKTATISFDVDPDGVAGLVPYSSKYKNQFFAAYPADAAVSTNGFHSYYYSDFTRTNEDLMIAYDKDDMFVFTHVCSAIAFTVPDIDGNPGTNDFDSYIFSGNNGEIVGYSSNYVARYALNKDDSEQKDFPYSGDGVHTCTGPLTEITGPVVCDGSTLNFIYMPIPAGQSKHQFDNGFTIKFVKGGSIVKYVETSTAFTLNRQDFLNIGSIPTDSKLKDYVDSHVCALAIESDDYDLYKTNGNKSANSYIVYLTGANASKVYRFKAVLGNSATAVSPSSVTVIWESYNDDTDPASINVIDEVDFDADYIYFKMPASPHAGNALIAAKNSVGDILWSWHIWVPSTTINTNTYGIYSSALMDRNLGALVAAESGSAVPVQAFGLTYQWGRKDPFVGPKATSGSSNATVAGTGPSAAAGQITLEESVKNPTSAGHANDGDWLTAPDNTLWVDASKTIYDPCPVGYRVPARDKSQLLMSSDLSAVTGWEENESNGYILLGSPVAVFPVGGYRDDYSVGSFSKVKQRVAYWTSYASSDAKGYMLNIRLAAYGNAHALAEGPKARGGYVRCVAE
jgi:hypothetical protein